MYGARSYSAPESANSGVKVVPSSTTSGMVPPAIDVEILSWASAQGMNSTSTSTPCSSAKAELAASKNPVSSGFVPSMIQTEIGRASCREMVKISCVTVVHIQQSLHIVSQYITTHHTMF